MLYFEPHRKIKKSSMAHQNARMPCIAKRITSVKKVKHAIFFTPKGLAIQVSIPKGKSMDATFYRKKSP